MEVGKRTGRYRCLKGVVVGRIGMGEGVGVSSHWFFEIRPARENGQRGPVYPARRPMQHSMFVSCRTHGCKRARYCQGAHP